MYTPGNQTLRTCIFFHTVLISAHNKYRIFLNNVKWLVFIICKDCCIYDTGTRCLLFVISMNVSLQSINNPQCVPFLIT